MLLYEPRATVHALQVSLGFSVPETIDRNFVPSKNRQFTVNNFCLSIGDTTPDKGGKDGNAQ